MQPNGARWRGPALSALAISSMVWVSGALASDGSSWQSKQKPEEKAKPEAIVRYEKALARALAAERKVAARGDLLTPDLVLFLRQQIETVMAGPDGPSVLATIFEESPELEDVSFEVNAVYPEGAPLSTVPPSLLERFPSLPEGVQYRFVGCRLILLERDARLILDYTEGCLWEADPDAR